MRNPLQARTPPTLLRKLRNRRGYTMVELLCVLAILALLSTATFTAVSLALNGYRRNIQKSEAITLCATLATAVSDELRYCIEPVTGLGGELLQFFSYHYGYGQRFSTNSDGELLLGTQKLLSSAAYPSGLRAHAEVRCPTSDSSTFSVTLTITDSDGNLLANSEFQVRSLNAA